MSGRSRAGLQSPEAISTRAQGREEGNSPVQVLPQGRAEGQLSLQRAHQWGSGSRKQPYIIKEWRELVHQLQSGGAGLLPLHMTYHTSEDKQGLHLVVTVGILLGLHDVWQQDQHFSCLHEAQNFLFVKR